MSSSDSAMFEDLKDRVARLEGRLQDILERLDGKLLPEEAEVDHTADRQERADMFKRGPGRPPGPRAA